MLLLKTQPFSEVVSFVMPTMLELVDVQMPTKFALEETQPRLSEDANVNKDSISTLILKNVRKLSLSLSQPHLSAKLSEILTTALSMVPTLTTKSNAILCSCKPETYPL